MISGAHLAFFTNHTTKPSSNSCLMMTAGTASVQAQKKKTTAMTTMMAVVMKSRMKLAVMMAVATTEATTKISYVLRQNINLSRMRLTFSFPKC